MSIVSTILVVLVALLFFYIMYLETFATESESTSRVFNIPQEELKRKNLIDFIKNRVNSGMVYIGESAGAIITSKDIEYNDLMDDKTIAKDLKEYSGLNLVDFYIVPHLNEFPFEESAKQTVEKYKDKLNIIAINNSQAIIVKDDKFEIK